jgi:hypothetical protein
VEKNVKFRLNLMEADQFIAKNAIPSEDQREDTNLAGSIHLPSAIFRFSISKLASTINNNRQNTLLSTHQSVRVKKDNAY